MMTEGRWTNNVSSEDRLEHAYLVSDGGSYSRSYLVLDWGERQARIDWRASSETGCTFYEWHGHQAALRLPPNVDARRLAEWLTDNAERLASIADGYESVWDGNNHIAQFSPATRTLLEALEMEAEQWEEREALALPEGQGVWAASEWLYDSRTEHVGPRSTDAEIAAVAAQLTKEALAEGIRLEDAEEYLQSVRDELREETDES